MSGRLTEGQKTRMPRRAPGSLARFHHVDAPLGVPTTKQRQPGRSNVGRPAPGPGWRGSFRLGPPPVARKYRWPRLAGRLSRCYTLVMPSRVTQTAFRFQDADLRLLDAAQERLGIKTRSETLRYIIRTWAAANGVALLPPEPAPKRPRKRKTRKA